MDRIIPTRNLFADYKKYFFKKMGLLSEAYRRVEQKQLVVSNIDREIKNTRKRLRQLNLSKLKAEIELRDCQREMSVLQDQVNDLEEMVQSVNPDPEGYFDL